jgi:hypothetical protein
MQRGTKHDANTRSNCKASLGIDRSRSPGFDSRPENPKRNVLAHLDRLHRIREVNLPAELGQAVHQGRLTQLAHEGAQMSAQHLRELESRRRHATLVAVLLDTEATITDQIFDMHDRIVGRMFNDAKRKHELGFAESGKAINEKVRLYARVGHALIGARQKGLDPYAAIEGVVTWDSSLEALTRRSGWRSQNHSIICIFSPQAMVRCGVTRRHC